jgi:hypothetical protein
MKKIKIKVGEPVPSPCVDICTINNKNGMCDGCYRTIHEITDWSVMSDNEKIIVLDQLEDRMFK